MLLRRGSGVSYRGVQVQVPSSWPVIDGMHTARCGVPFSQGATAYVGPNDQGLPSCLPGGGVGRDGVWLHPGPRPANARTLAGTGSDVAVVAEAGSAGWPVKSFWLQGIEVDVGTGHDRQVRDAIVTSIRFVPGAPDTPVEQVCGRRSGAARMPRPERLAHLCDRLSGTGTRRLRRRHRLTTDREDRPGVGALTRPAWSRSSDTG